MTRRDRLVIIVVATVAAIAAAWLLVVAPKRDEAAKLGAQVSSAQQQLDSARSQLAQNAAASRQYASNYAALARLGEAVPASDDVPSLIVELQNAADGARVDFLGLQNAAAGSGGSTAGPGAAATGATGVSTGQFSFTFSGTYFQLSNFFDRLQKFVVPAGNGVLVRGRLISLNSVALTPAAGGFPHINATITATTYRQPAPTGSAGATSPATASTAAGTPASAPTSPTPAPAAAITPVR